MNRHRLRSEPPFVSIVVPLYNKEPYIRRALNSILEQSYCDFEVVVVNDGSTDAGAEIVARINDERIRLIHQENAGEGAARNCGIRHSRGDLIAMLDADDEWHPDFLQAVVGLYCTFPEAGLFAAGYQTIYSGDFVVETTLSRQVFGGESTGLVVDYFRYARVASIVWSSAQAIPRTVYEDIGLFVENEPMGPDLDMWGRVALHYPIAYDIRSLAYYHNDAMGRVVTQWANRPTFPPFVTSARQAMADNRVPDAKRTSLETYLNALLLDYLARVIASGDRTELQRTLDVEFYPSSFHRVEIAYLKMASKVMPMRALYYLERLRRSRYFSLLWAEDKQTVVRKVVQSVK